MAYSKKIQAIVNKAVKAANSNSARRATRAATAAKASQTSAVRSTAGRTRSNTLKGVEKNMGGVQRAGRSVDKGLTYAGAKLSEGGKAVGRVAGKAALGESKLMTKIGRAIGSDSGKKYDAKMGRALTYGSLAAVPASKVVAETAYGSPNSSWSLKKKEGSGSGWSAPKRPSPYGL